MWLLISNQIENPVTYYLLHNTTYTIGRNTCDIKLDDRTVSRKHAELISSSAQDSQQPSLILVDYSKFGTEVNGKRYIGKEKGEVVHLKHADKIQIGTGDDFFEVQYNPIVFCTSGITEEEKAKYQESIAKLGSTSNSVLNCTHLVLSAFKVTHKLLLALINSKFIISWDWIDAVLERKTLTTPFPDPLLYTPQGNHALLTPHTLFPNIARSTLFHEISFVVFDKETYDSLQEIVTSARGDFVKSYGRADPFVNDFVQDFVMFKSRTTRQIILLSPNANNKHIPLLENKLQSISQQKIPLFNEDDVRASILTANLKLFEAKESESSIKIDHDKEKATVVPFSSSSDLHTIVSSSSSNTVHTTTIPNSAEVKETGNHKDKEIEESEVTVIQAVKPPAPIPTNNGTQGFRPPLTKSRPQIQTKINPNKIVSVNNNNDNNNNNSENGNSNKKEEIIIDDNNNNHNNNNTGVINTNPYRSSKKIADEERKRKWDDLPDLNNTTVTEDLTPGVMILVESPLILPSTNNQKKFKKASPTTQQTSKQKIELEVHVNTSPFYCEWIEKAKLEREKEQEIEKSGNALFSEPRNLTVPISKSIHLGNFKFKTTK